MGATLSKPELLNHPRQESQTVQRQPHGPDERRGERPELPTVLLRAATLRVFARWSTSPLFQTHSCSLHMLRYHSRLERDKEERRAVVSDEKKNLEL
ncbi:unnamed protein product [Sphagnum tenellum]